MSEKPLSDHPFCQQEQEPDYYDTVCEEELRVHARQLEIAVRDLLFIIREVNDATGSATSRTDIQEARQLVGMDSVLDRESP